MKKKTNDKKYVNGKKYSNVEKFINYKIWKSMRYETIDKY